MKTIYIVCGERDWKDKETIFCVLDEALTKHESAWFLAHGDCHADPEMIKAMHADFILRHGACEGADIAANEWGLARGVTIERFHADWRPQGVYDPSAGPIRNKRQARAEPQADECLAFWSGKMRIKHGKPEYSGTLNMIQAALAEGIEARIVPPKKEPA